MTLSPEQFNQIALIKDLDAVANDVKEMRGDINNLIKSMDGLTKGFADLKSELISNVVAHDRFETRISRVEKQIF